MALTIRILTNSIIFRLAVEKYTRRKTDKRERML